MFEYLPVFLRYIRHVVCEYRKRPNSGHIFEGCGQKGCHDKARVKVNGYIYICVMGKCRLILTVDVDVEFIINCQNRVKP